MLNKLNKVIKNTILIIFFFLIFIDLSFGQENQFKSRLLFKKIPEADNLDTKTKDDEKELELPDIIKLLINTMNKFTFLRNVITSWVIKIMPLVI